MTQSPPIPMPASLLDASPALPWTPGRIARVEESRLAYALGSIAPIARAWAGGVIAGGPPGTWINQTVGVGLDGAGPGAAEIAEMRGFYESRGLLPRIELAPFVPGPMLDHLSEAGFRVKRFESILGCDPRAWREPRGWSPPPGVTIRRVADGERSIERCRAIAAFGCGAMEGRTPSDDSIVLLQRAIAFEHAIVLLAEVDGRPAGMAMLDVFPGIATLYFGATEAGFRRRGIQAALMIERLRIARERGIPLATIGSDPDGPTERNALRLGMWAAYTKTVFVRPA